MVTLLFLLSFASCAKQSLIKSAQVAFHNNPNCLETLKEYMKSAGCEKMQTEERQYEILFRCYKDDKERGKFWDNYIFRMSNANLAIHESAIEEIEANTICIDEDVRIEAYKPR